MVYKKKKDTVIKMHPSVRNKLDDRQRKLLDDKITKTQENAIFAKAREDFTIFAMLVGSYVQDGYTLYDVHKEIAHNFNRIEKENLLGGVFSTPPRLGKSLLTDIFVAWQVGLYPQLNQAIITYGEKLSIVHIINIRKIVKSPMFKRIFPKAVISKSIDSKVEFAMTQGGTITALGRGSGLSGRTIHRIYIDDIVKEINEIYSETIRETLNGIVANILQRRISGSHYKPEHLTKVIVIGTRYFADDPIGVFIKLVEEKWGGIVRNYPAIVQEDMISDITGRVWKKKGELISPELVGRDAIETAEMNYTPEEFKAVYLGIPLSDTEFFKKEWLTYIDEKEVLDKNCRTFLAIDPALTVSEHSDDTGFAIGFLDKNGKVYIDAWGEKLQPKQLVERIFELHDKYNFERVGMEKMMFSQGLEPFFADEMKKRNRLIRFDLLSHGNKAKEMRILGALPALYSHGTFVHIKGKNTKLEQQMFSFPKGKHDDVLDAVAILASMTNGEKEKQIDLGEVIIPTNFSRTTW